MKDPTEMHDLAINSPAGSFLVPALAKLRRVLRMPLPELAGRGQQGALKWLERVGVTGRVNGGPQRVFGKMASNLTLAGIRARVQEGEVSGAARMLFDHFQEAGPDRFFVGATSEQTRRLLADHLPDASRQIISEADTICRGRFDLLGFSGLSFGDPLDWHLDPVSGRRAPLAHWSRINPLDRGLVGDSKVVWELNRHQWLVRLGQAYQVTGDERYGERFATYIREWMRANPTGIGINWASSLEVALRLISWCWALLLFRESRALSPALFVEIADSVYAHATHVERYLSRYFSPNTHLTGEALGLFYTGVVWPELQPARRWRSLGQRILLEQSERQILRDGVHFELSTCYQRYTVEIYLHFLILAARNGVAIPAAVGERVQRMLDFLLTACRPDGSIPQMGDADGGRLLPLAPRAPDDFRDVFSTAAAVFGRSDYAWAAGGPAPETLWLLGPTGLEAFEAMSPAPPADPPSRLFAEGGYAVMRSGWQADAYHLIFDVGPLGCPISAGHGHADLLSIQCAAFGEAYLIDPGTYSYTGEPAWRDFFRSTAAHSTVRVDHVEQAAPAGPFRWGARPRVRLRQWLSSGSLDLADAEHDAYCRLPDPVVHRRRVAFVKPRYWAIIDDLEGKAEHRVEVRFQFAPIEVSVESGPWVRARGRKGQGLLLGAFATVPLKLDLVTGEREPIQGWVSPAYGVRKPAPCVVYSADARLPLRIVTLLLPVESPSAPPPVSLIAGDDARPRGVALEDGQEMLLFGEREVELRLGSCGVAGVVAAEDWVERDGGDGLS